MTSNTTSSPMLDPAMSSECISSEINALPTDWVPSDKPSKVIEKMFTERKQLHKQRLDQLRDDMTRVKIDAEEKMRKTSMKMRNMIQNTKKTMDGLFERYTFSFDKSKGLNLKSKAAYEDMYRHLKDIVVKKCTHLKMEIMNHDADLKGIENCRMAALTKVLKRAREDLERLTYKLPHDLQLYFENEMMQLNQMTLCNYATFSELQMQLMHVVLSCENMWMKKVDVLRDQFEVNYEKFQQKKSLESDEDDAGDGVMSLSKVQAFTDKIANQMCHLASTFEGTLDVMYGVLNRIGQGKYDEVQQIDANFVGIPKKDYLNIYRDVYASLFEVECFELVSSYTTEMMKRWEDVVDVFAAEVDVCMQATLAGLHVWDKHFVRQFEATDIFALDLWDVVNKSNDAADAMVMDLHKEVDEVRIAPDEDSLKVAMGECKRRVDAINKSIEKGYDKQTKHFDKLREMMIQEGDILFLEMSYFVKCMPSEDDINPTIFRGRRSRIKFIPPEEKPELMKVFDSEIKALHNWLYGVSEHLKTATEQCRERSLAYANNWIDNNFIIVYWHYKIKTSLLADTWQRIFHYVYRVRLAELITHQKRLDRHLLGINEEIIIMSSIENLFSPNIFWFKQQANKLFTSLKRAKSTLEITGITKQLTAFKDTCIREMNESQTEFNNKTTLKLNELLCLNVQFLKSIKFFSEQGDYNPEEYNEVKKQIAKANKDMSKDKTTIDRDREDELKQAVQEIKDIEWEIIDSSSEMNTRFGFKEFIKEHLDTVRGSMKEETRLLVDKNNSLSAYVDRLERLGEQNIGKIEYLDDFTSNCEFLERIFKELYDMLLQSEVFNLSDSFFLPGSTDMSKKGDVIRENIEAKLGMTDIENEHQNVISTGTSRAVAVDFNIVFPKAPGGDDYMAHIVRILFDSLEVLQKQAQEYYKKLIGSDDEENKYEKRLKTFMISHLSKYFFYQLQCDEILLEVIINYILQLDELLTYITEYYKRSLEQFVEEKLAELNKNCTHYKAEIHANRDKIENEYRKIIDQLKPLHGHPKNRNLLDNLIAQLNSLEDNAINEQEVMDNLFVQYQAKMEDNMCTFEEQVDRMESRLKMCVQRFITRYIANEGIFNQLRAKLTYFERIMNPGEMVIDGSRATINIEIVDRLNSKLELLKMGLKVSTTEFSSFIETKWTEASTIKEKYSSDNYLTVGSTPSLDLYLIREEFRDKQMQCLKELESLTGFLEMCEFWSGVWKNNVDQVNAFYTVKYVPVPKVEAPAQKAKKPKSRKL